MYLLRRKIKRRGDEPKNPGKDEGCANSFRRRHSEQQKQRHGETSAANSGDPDCESDEKSKHNRDHFRGSENV
jgi:hypothetical protein